MARRIDGTGTVRLSKPAISVIYLPWSSPSLTPSYTTGAGETWSTEASGMQIIRWRPFTADGDGWAFISANASVWESGSTCIGRFRIGVDSTTGDSNYDRTVALYPDSGDGTHKALAITTMVPVTAGAHNAFFVGERYSGDCTLEVIDPTLTILTPQGPSFTSFLPLVVR